MLFRSSENDLTGSDDNLIDLISFTAKQCVSKPSDDISICTNTQWHDGEEEETKEPKRTDL